jgi:hypothetical protein
LSRRPGEDTDAGLAGWYHRLLETVRDHGVRDGDWRLLEAAGWPDNETCRSLLAWSWTADGGARHVIVINFSARPAQGRIQLGWPDLPGRDWRFTPLMGGDGFDRAGDELAADGLFVDLPPWGFHLLSVAAGGAGEG